MMILFLAIQATVANPLQGRVNQQPVVRPNPQRGRLVQQQVRGAQRICFYGTGNDAPVTAIGRGEPCPFHYRRPDPAPQSAIPMMATLSSQRRANGRLVCTYSYAGRRYLAGLPTTSFCPVSPISTTQPLEYLGTDERR